MPVARVERRLAAIMATDIVGYSRPIETDEARTLTLRLRPDFSTAEYMRKSVLLEHTEDRELLREGLVKAGLPV
jgi:class 3 adenylate cyclase